MDKPSKRIRWLSWLILGSFSVFFAEVVSGSDMFPYYHPWGILVVMPLYTLHFLVLSRIVYNYGRPRFYTLFLAGAIFGMYEAYITKVLWDPFWGDAIFKVGGVALVETVVLVLWWHPVMSFIIPLFVGERTLTGTEEAASSMPDRLLNVRKNRRFLLAIVITMGFTQGGNSPSPAHSLASGLSTTAFLILLIHVWKVKTRGSEYNFKDLLPNKREFRVLLFLLATLYLVTGVYLRPEALPGLGPQVVIWAGYMVLFTLLYLSLKKSSKTPTGKREKPGSIPSLKSYIWLAIIFTLSSMISKALGIGMLMMALVWLAGGLLGIFMLIRSIKDAYSQSP